MFSSFRFLSPIAILAASASAQQVIENFNYPDGPIPAATMTAQSGSWAIRNGKAVASTGVWGYVTMNGVSAFNGVVECDCKWSTAGLQFGGVAMRHAGTSANDAVMAKIQSNSATPQGFDTAWLYEQPGTAVSRTGIAPPLTDVRVRMVVLGTNAIMSIDTDRNGTFDMVVGTKVLTAHTAPGLVGINGFGSATAQTEVDNFAFFDAVLAEQSGSRPRIGTSYRMDLVTPATQITPFVGFAALGAGTIPLGTRGVPLALDPLFSLSLSVGGALGLTGLTDANGLGAPMFNIPNNPVLIGLGVFVSTVTLGATQPFGIGHISNNHYFVIEA